MGCVASREGEKASLKSGRIGGAFPTHILSRKSFRFASSPSAVCDCTPARPDDEESDSKVLSREIAARQRSAVHAHVTRFEQLHARAQFPPVLRDVRTVERGGKTDANVSLFERLEQAAREAPKLTGVPAADLRRESTILDRVRSFESLEKKRLDENAKSLGAFKSARAPPARAWAGNKIPVAVSAYSM